MADIKEGALNERVFKGYIDRVDSCWDTDCGLVFDDFYCGVVKWLILSKRA